MSMAGTSGEREAGGGGEQLALQMALCAGSRLLNQSSRCQDDAILAEDGMHFMRTGKNLPEDSLI